MVCLIFFFQIIRLVIPRTCCLAIELNPVVATFLAAIDGGSTIAMMGKS